MKSPPKVTLFTRITHSAHSLGASIAPSCGEFADGSSSCRRGAQTVRNPVAP